MEDVFIDASTFQKPLGKLAETVGQKVYREGPKLGMNVPAFIFVDIFVLVRKAMFTYDLMFYLNADDRQATDCYWRPEYSVVALPLVRNVIDCLYNITAILQDPVANGRLFRESGFKRLYEAWDEDESRFTGRPEWAEWLRKARADLDFGIRECGLTTPAIKAQTKTWPTFGGYIRRKKKGPPLTAHQEFLRKFTYGDWRQYSAMLHGSFEGLLPVAVYYTTDTFRHEDRPLVDAAHPRLVSVHITRVALTLLCIVTELQGYFHFSDTSRIDERIHQMWNALMLTADAKEFYQARYEQFMKDKGINP